MGTKQIFIHVLTQVHLFLKVNSIKISEIFFCLRANGECNHTISFAIRLPSINFKVYSPTQLSQLHQNVITTQPPILKIQNSQLLFSAAYINILLPLKVSPSFSRAVPSLQPIFTSRTNRYYQDTFITVNSPFCPPVTSAMPLKTLTNSSSVLRLVVTVYRYP